MNPNPNFITVLLLKLIQVWDRVRLLRHVRNCPGLQIDASASSNFATAKFDLAPGAKLVIGPGVVTERIREGVRFEIGAGASVVVEEGAWLRTDIAPVFLRAAPSGFGVPPRPGHCSTVEISASPKTCATWP